MSLISGSETRPSGRTGTLRLNSGFFQTEMSRTSSGPIRYSAVAAAAARLTAAAAAAFAGALCAHVDAATPRHRTDTSTTWRIIGILPWHEPPRRAAGMNG